MGDVVYVRDDKTVWTRAKLVDGQVRRLEDNKLLNVGEEFLLCAENQRPEDDMTNLRHIHEASILENLHARFKKQQCCTFISNVLLSVNPIVAVEEPLHLVGKKEVLGTPHPFSVAECSFQQLERDQRSQCIIISGESGSGKSEACKRVIRHLVLRTQDSCDVDEQILAASPILESFGNAQTCSNTNSSRFGKFVNLYFSGRTDTFKYASIDTYLLERSRVVVHDIQERSFHVFYQLLAGADQALTTRCHLDKYKGQMRKEVQAKSDREHFARLRESMSAFSMSDEGQDRVMQTVAAVLHLCEIRFENRETVEGNVASVCGESGESLRACVDLLGLDEQVLVKLLCEKTMTLRGETLVTQRNAEAASQARDAVAKALYRNLFEWLVHQINQGLGNNSYKRRSQDNNFVGILDIFGFERFEKNSFEQLLINFANEALQTTFNDHLFQAELALYREEGLDTSGMSAPPDDTCRACLDLLQVTKDKNGKRSIGLLSALDTISVGPEPSDKKLITHLHRSFQNRACFLTPHPRLADRTFIVQHYAGPVPYQIHGFVEKNTDRLPRESELVFLQSSVKLVGDMFRVGAGVKEDAGQTCATSGSRRSFKQKPLKKSKSIAATFEEQIATLLALLGSTTCSFVRCVKPNQFLSQADGFDPTYVSKQLQCLSIPQTAQLLQSGLPGRIRYKELYQTFSEVLPSLPTQLTETGAFNATIVKTLLRSMDVDTSECLFGKTRVFFANGALARVDEKLRALRDRTVAVKDTLADDIERACTLHALRRLLVMAGGVTRKAKQRRERMLRKRRAAVFVQRNFRRHQQRIKFLHIRDCVLEIQHVWRVVKSHRQEHTQSKAARVLQSWARVQIARGKLRRFVQAVRVLQRTWRSKNVLFSYSTNDELDNETICTTSECSGLAAAWEGRMALQQEREEETEIEDQFLLFKRSYENEDVDDDVLIPDAKLAMDEDYDDDVDEALLYRCVSDAASASPSTSPNPSPGKSESHERKSATVSGAAAGGDWLGSANKNVTISSNKQAEAKQGDDDDDDEKGGKVFDEDEDGYCADDDVREEGDFGLYDEDDDHLDMQSDSGGSERKYKSLEYLRHKITQPEVPELNHRKHHSSDELTQILLQLSSTSLLGGENMNEEVKVGEAAHTGFSGRKSTGAGPRGSCGSVEVDMASISSFRSQREESSSKGAGLSSKNPLKKIRLPTMFKMRTREERLIVRKLKTGMKKKHYRQVVEALMRARELGIKSPEVFAAESMIIRVKAVHAQQLLREAMVTNDMVALRDAIEHASRFGMTQIDSEGILRQATELYDRMMQKQVSQGNLQRKKSRRRLTRKKSSASFKGASVA